MCMYDVCEITYIREINDNGRNTNTIIKNLLIVHTHISENIRYNGAPSDSDYQVFSCVYYKLYPKKHAY